MKPVIFLRSQNLLLPNKHITFAESLLGLGSFVLENLNPAKNIDSLWWKYEKVKGKEYPAHHSFDNFILAIDILFAIGAIEISADGNIIRQLET